MMAIAVVLHRVRDFTAWRQVYDQVGDLQRAGNVVEEHVYRAKDDPDNVLVFHRFPTMADAESFLTSQELRDAMRRAGVEGAPRIEFYEEA
jgi:hypothetical protein